MSAISSVASISDSSVSSSVESSVDQQTIAALQIQLAVFSKAADGQNTQAKAAYQELQSALTSGDLSQAQAALATLQRINESANPTAASASNPAVGNDGGGLNVKA